MIEKLEVTRSKLQAVCL